MKKMAIPVAASIPPTTAVPMECRLADPAPVESIRGRHPRMKAREVMMMGRKRRCAASAAASKRLKPCWCRIRANSTMRMAFLEARPMRVTRAIWK